MTGNPHFPDDANSRSARILGGLVQPRPDQPVADNTIAIGRPGRELCFYPARQGYELQTELDFLSNRAMEPNVFFTGRFLAPAMPRLEDRIIRLALIRDNDERRSRIRFLMPFSIEKPGFSIGAPIIRAWSNPFGPLGVPLLDAEDAAETIDNFYEALTSPTANLPGVLVLPDIRLKGKFAQLARAVAIGRNLPLTVTDTFSRPMLESLQDGQTYLRHAISASHLRELRRQWNLLEKVGSVSYNVARQPGDIRVRMEEFLALEASGWKGKRGTALSQDPGDAAFIRGAVPAMAASGHCEIISLRAGDTPVAAAIVLRHLDRAFYFKIGIDERFAKFSPGVQLTLDLTRHLCADPAIASADPFRYPRATRTVADFAVRDGKSTLTPVTSTPRALLRTSSVSTSTVSERPPC